MELALYAVMVLGILGAFSWWLAAVRPQKVPVSNLRGRLDYFVEYCEPGAALMFSLDGRHWPIRVELSSLEHDIADLSVTVFRGGFPGPPPSDLESAVAAVDRDTPELWSPTIEVVLRLIRLALDLESVAESHRIVIKGAPIIYGSRTDARVRDDYRTIPPTVPLLGRIRRHYERKYSSLTYDDPRLFRTSAVLEEARAPDFPQYVHSGKSAA